MSTSGSLLVLSASDVERVIATLTISELQILMARVFSCISSPPQSPSIMFAPHRTSIPTTNHTALFMPSRISTPSLLGTTIKVVCVPRDPADTRGLPASTLVLDEIAGGVKAIVNARSLTALRNAAGSLLSTNLVGLRPKSIVVFGAGKQIEAHLDLHIRSFPSVVSCTIINRTINSRVVALESLMKSRFPAVPFRCIASTYKDDASSQEHIKQTLSSASLIICATSSKYPLFPSSWVPTGTHVILIGSYTPAMHEVDGDLVRRAIRTKDDNNQARQILLVDSRESCLVEAGELIEAAIDVTQMAEIGELVRVDESGGLEFSKISPEPHAPGGDSVRDINDDTSSGPITMFKSVGLGLQDVAIACVVVSKAQDMGIGTWVEEYDI